MTIRKDEILSNEQLDTISGGYAAETDAIIDALGMTSTGIDLNLTSKIEKRLKDEFGIKANVNFAPENYSEAEGANKYFKDGKQLTHAAVMKIIRKKYPYKNPMDDILG